MLVAVGLAGCGGRVVSHQSIEALLHGRLPHAGRISCPDVEDTPGKEFTCTAAGGRVRTIRVRLERHEQIRLLGAT